MLAAFAAKTLQGTSVKVRPVSALDGLTPFDVLVIDEGQDLMTFDSLEQLESLVVGGWANGRWTVFLDQNSQAHLYDDFDPEALQFLQSFGPVKPTLKFNCRNTREIAFQTRAYTGADTGVATAGAGPEVTFVVVDSNEAELAALEKHLRSLSEQEVAPENITIVSLRGEWESSAARGLKAVRKGRLAQISPAIASVWPGGGMTWSSALDIKGMENRFVCVIDIDSVVTDKELDLLYVALSRPRAGLWVATSPQVSEQMTERLAKHLDGAMGAYRKAAT